MPVKAPGKAAPSALPAGQGRQLRGVFKNDWSGLCLLAEAGSQSTEMSSSPYEATTRLLGGSRTSHPAHLIFEEDNSGPRGDRREFN